LKPPLLSYETSFKIGAGIEEATHWYACFMLLPRMKK